MRLSQEGRAAGVNLQSGAHIPLLARNVCKSRLFFLSSRKPATDCVDFLNLIIYKDLELWYKTTRSYFPLHLKDFKLYLTDSLLRFAADIIPDPERSMKMSPGRTRTSNLVQHLEGTKNMICYVEKDYRCRVFSKAKCPKTDKLHLWMVWWEATSTSQTLFKTTMHTGHIGVSSQSHYK